MSQFELPDPLNQPVEPPDDVVESSVAADEGEGSAPAGLSDVVDTDDEPPEPAFLIVKNAFGPGADSVKFVDGTPVGVWLAEQHADWTPEEILIHLTRLGLPSVHAEAFARRREQLINSRRTLAELGEAFPGSVLVQAGAKELERDQRMEPIRAAFIKTKGEKK